MSVTKIIYFQNQFYFILKFVQIIMHLGITNKWTKFDQFTKNCLNSRGQIRV